MKESKIPPQAGLTVLGIDPGTALVGFGVLREREGGVVPLDYGCITVPRDARPRRLKRIHDEVALLLERFSPDVLVLERLFFNKNIKTALHVGEACGVILLAAEEKEVPFAEYTPLEVKESLSGYGMASKQEMRLMVQILLNLPELPSPDDAADGLAIALCHLTRVRSGLVAITPDTPSREMISRDCARRKR